MIDNLLSDIGDNTPTLTNPAVVINLAGVVPVKVGQDTKSWLCHDAAKRPQQHSLVEATRAESRNPVLGNSASLRLVGKIPTAPWKNAEASAKSFP